MEQCWPRIVVLAGLSCVDGHLCRAVLPMNAEQASLQLLNPATVYSIGADTNHEPVFTECYMLAIAWGVLTGKFYPANLFFGYICWAFCFCGLIFRNQEGTEILSLACRKIVEFCVVLFEAS